eukprot:scaffold72973_cov30-Tisochrysis_lutea.AAC.1
MQRQSSLTMSYITPQVSNHMSGLGQQPGGQRASPWSHKVASVSDDLHLTPQSDNGLDAEA